MCSVVIFSTGCWSPHIGHLSWVAHRSWEHKPWPHGRIMLRIGAVSQAQQRLILQEGTVAVPYWLRRSSSSCCCSFWQVSIRAVASSWRIQRASMFATAAVRVWVLGVWCMLIKILVHWFNLQVRLLWTSRICSLVEGVGVAAVCVSSGGEPWQAMLDKVSTALCDAV